MLEIGMKTMTQREQLPFLVDVFANSQLVPAQEYVNCKKLLLLSGNVCVLYWFIFLN